MFIELMFNFIEKRRFMFMAKKVNIVGAGLAGLSAGIYLQQSGIETEIFELAGWAGGMCTTWVRNGYRFDGCIHWMVGTKPGDEFYKLYREVGALEEDTVIYNDASIKMEVGGVLYEIPMIKINAKTETASAFCCHPFIGRKNWE